MLFTLHNVLYTHYDTYWKLKPHDALNMKVATIWPDAIVLVTFFKNPLKLMHTPNMIRINLL